MLKNRMNKLYHAYKIQPLKIVVENTHLMMWARSNFLTRRYLPTE